MMVVVMAMGLVIMVVMMRIGGDDPCLPPGRTIFFANSGSCWMLFRPAFAADMRVEADHPVAVGHHHVEIMTDHQGFRSRACGGFRR